MGFGAYKTDTKLLRAGYAHCVGVIEKKRSKKVQLTSSCILHMVGDRVAVKLHNTNIAKMSENGNIELAGAGWVDSQMTRGWLTEILHAWCGQLWLTSCRPTTRSRLQYVISRSHFNAKPITRFYDGVTFDINGKLLTEVVRVQAFEMPANATREMFKPAEPMLKQLRTLAKFDTSGRVSYPSLPGTPQPDTLCEHPLGELYEWFKYYGNGSVPNGIAKWRMSLTDEAIRYHRIELKEVPVEHDTP